LWAGEGTASNGGAAFAVIRFNANGTVDQTFGTGGVATATFGNAVQSAQAVLVQPDGKILVGGQVLFGGRPPRDIGGLARFNSNGSIDTTFGSGGQEPVPNSNSRRGRRRAGPHHRTAGRLCARARQGQAGLRTVRRLRR
jgi:uncharacterized delta-60 repeat protein